jgi:hypothetical protein
MNNNNNNNNNTNGYYYPSKTYHNSNYQGNNNSNQQHKMQPSPQYYIASPTVNAVPSSATSQTTQSTNASFVPINVFFDPSNPDAHHQVHPAQYSAAAYYNSQIATAYPYSTNPYDATNGGYYCAPNVVPIPIPISSAAAPQLVAQIPQVEQYQQQQQPQASDNNNNNNQTDNLVNKNNAQIVSVFFLFFFNKDLLLVFF